MRLHAPVAHVSSGAHARSHDPQCAAERDVSTQSTPQTTLGSSQADASSPLLTATSSAAASSAIPAPPQEHPEDVSSRRPKTWLPRPSRKRGDEILTEPHLTASASC